MSVFVNPVERRLRAGWRLLVAFVLLIVFAVLPALAMGETLSWARKRGFLAGLDDASFDKAGDLVVGPVFLVLVLLAVAAAARWLDRRRFTDLGFRIDGRWWRDLAAGFIASGFMMGLLFAALQVRGYIEVVGVGRVEAGLPVALALAFTLVKVVCVAVCEETFARGYQLRNLTEGLTGVRGMGERGARAAAVALTSMMFAALHLFNPELTVLGGVLLVVNGVLFAVPVLLTGQLGGAIGLHLGWNLFQGLVFGFPVRGGLEPASLLEVRSIGPDWITGGAFGPVGGLPSLAVMLLGMAALTFWFRRGNMAPRRA